MALAFVVALMTITVAAEPIRSTGADEIKQVAVVFAPWASAEDSFLSVVAAGGRPVRNGLFGSIFIASIDDATAIKALYLKGAWLVLNPLLLGGCIGEQEVSETHQQRAQTAPENGNS